MTDHATRLARAEALVSDEDELSSDQPAVAGWLQRLCRVAARELPAFGVGVVLLSDEQDVVTAAASGAVSSTMERLQLTLGEGPGLTAYRARRPVLVPDLGGSGGTDWPAFARSAALQGVRAVFAFPLQVGGARVGAMDVYRDSAGEMPTPMLSQAALFADLVTDKLVGAEATSSGTARLVDDIGTSYEVYQAQGMVMIQLGLGAGDALARLRGHAFAHGLPLSQVASDVVSRRLILERDGPDPGREPAAHP